MNQQRQTNELHNSDDFEINLQKSWGMLLRRRYIVGATFLFVVAIGLTSIFRAPAVYKSSATLRIDRQASAVLGHQVQAFDQSSGYGYLAAMDFYETQHKLISSRPVAKKVVSILSLYPEQIVNELQEYWTNSQEQSADIFSGLPEQVVNKLKLLGLGKVQTRDKLLESLNSKVDPVSIIQGKIIVEPVDKSRLVKIGAEGSSPEQITQLANAIAESYVEFNLSQKRDTAQEAVSWLSDQVLDLKSKLTDSEMQLHEFKSKNNIVSVSIEDKRSILSQRLLHLNQRLSELTTDEILLKNQLKTLRQAIASGIDSSTGKVIGNNHVQDLKKSLTELKQVETEHASKYTKNHPKLISVREQIQLLEAQISKEINKIVFSINHDLSAKTGSIQGLILEIEKIKSETLAASKKSIDHNRLQRDAANNLQLYNLVLKRQKEAQLSQMLKSNNVQIIEPAMVPQSPIRPRKKLGALATLVIAFILSVALAVIVDLIDNTVKTQKNIQEATGAPFLGILPSISNSDEKELEATSGTPSKTQLGHRDQFIVGNPRSTIAECSRSIRTNLFFMSPENPARTIVVTSNGPQEGKSTVTINLGVVIAQSGKKTLIIDADMRRPRLHRSFGIANEAGLSSLIMHQAELDDVVKNVDGVENLDIIPCGPIPPNPAELLHTDSFKKLLEQLKERYEQIIFDSPPVSPVADAMVLGSMLDGVVFVAHAGKTRIPAIRQARGRLEDVGARLLGAVLNNVDLDRKSGLGYYDYQYYYYRSGYYYGENTEGAAS